MANNLSGSEYAGGKAYNAGRARMSPAAQSAARDSALAAGQNAMETNADEMTKGGTVFSGLQAPKFGNPFAQIVGGIKSGIHWLGSYDPYKKGK